MAWALAILLIVLVVVAASAIVLVIRNNQLSLARDLCLEALRQVNVQREQRHALVPEFVSLARACRGNSSVDVGDGAAIGSTAERDVACRELSSALTQAVSVGTEEPATPGDTTASVGPAEDQLTSAIDALAQIAKVRGETNQTHERCHVQLHDLYEHLLMVEHRLAAAVRYYNLVVMQYSTMRSSWISRPLMRVYRNFAHIAYTPNELNDDVPIANRTSEREKGTGYRPGSVFG